MVLPSGEKATEVTLSLCALCFGALADDRMRRLPLGKHPNSKRGACLHVSTLLFSTLRSRVTVQER